MVEARGDNDVQIVRKTFFMGAKDKSIPRIAGAEQLYQVKRMI